MRRGLAVGAVSGLAAVGSLLAGCGETNPQPPEAFVLPAQLTQEACADLGRLMTILPDDANSDPDLSPRQRLDAGEAVTRIAMTITDGQGDLPPFTKDLPSDLISDVSSLHTEVMGVVGQRESIRRARQSADSLSQRRCASILNENRGTLSLAPIDHPQLRVEICDEIGRVNQVLGNLAQEVTTENSMTVFNEAVRLNTISEQLMGSDKPGNFRWLPGAVEVQAWQTGLMSNAAWMPPDDAAENAARVQHWASAVYDANCVAPVG